MKYVAPLAVIATASAAGPNHEMLLRAIQLFDTNATVVTPSGAAQTQTGSYGYTSHNSKDCSASSIRSGYGYVLNRCSSMDGKTSSQYVGCTSSTYTLSYCSTSADCSSGCVNMEVPFSADCDAYGNKYFCSSDEASYNNFDELNQYTEYTYGSGVQCSDAKWGFWQAFVEESCHALGCISDATPLYAFETFCK